MDCFDITDRYIYLKKYICILLYDHELVLSPVQALRALWTSHAGAPASRPPPTQTPSSKWITRPTRCLRPRQPPASRPTAPLPTASRRSSPIIRRSSQAPMADMVGPTKRSPRRGVVAMAAPALAATTPQFHRRGRCQPAIIRSIRQ